MYMALQMYRGGAKTTNNTPKTTTFKMKHRIEWTGHQSLITKIIDRDIAQRYGTTIGATSAVDFCTVSHQ
jgi:hypothetical protein